MSNPDDYAYDDEGNVVRIRYGQPPEQSWRHSSIRPVSSAELALKRQREAEEEAQRERQKAQARAEEKKKREEERAARFKIISPISPQKRAMQLDEKLEDKSNSHGTDHD